MNRLRLPQEADLVPYSTSFLPGARWLVLAPHPDDEVLGPGATVALAVGRGVQIRVCVVTAGGAQGEAREREAEAMAAAAKLGVGAPQFWRLPDRSLRAEDTGLRHRLAAALDEFAPELLLVPSPVELHPDHRGLAVAAQRELRRRTSLGLVARPPAWVAAYEVATPLLPNVLVDAGAGWEAKRQALACHRSQLAAWHYDETMEALGVFRRLTVPTADRVEAFHLLPAAVVARLTAAAWACRMGSSLGVRPR